MYIVSDRNESIIKSISRVYPAVPHFACIWHLWNNVYKKFKKSHSKLSEEDVWTLELQQSERSFTDIHNA